MLRKEIFAGLDENGNLTDSGSKAGDFANAEHTHSSLKNGNGVASIPEFFRNTC